MAEWLRRQPAKLMGFARVGSNPTVVVIFWQTYNCEGYRRGCSSLGRAVGSQSAGTGIETLLLHHFSTDPYHHVASANGVSVTLKLPKL